MTLTIHKDLEQGSDEWLQFRCGVMSASIMNDILTPTLEVAANDKTRAAVYEIACQRVTKYVEPQFWTASMLRGAEDEVVAREYYSGKYGPVDEIGGMVREFDFGRIWYSPDGLAWDDGLIEVKSRRQGLHFKTIVMDEVPKEHILQCQAALLVSGRSWIDYISICRGMPLFVKRVFPEQKYQEAIKEAAIEFERQVQETIDTYHERLAGVDVIETEREEPETEVYFE